MTTVKSPFSWRVPEPPQSISTMNSKDPRQKLSNQTTPLVLSGSSIFAQTVVDDYLYPLSVSGIVIALSYAQRQCVFAQVFPLRAARLQPLPAG